MSQTGLGAALRRAREEQGLTLEDAERDTRISKRYLDALENERFDVVPAPVYARGFLRSYSQYLGLDPNEVLSLYPRDDEPQPRQQRGQSRGHERDRERQVGLNAGEREQFEEPEPGRREPRPLRPATLTHRDPMLDAERRQAFVWIAIAVGAIVVVAIIAFLIAQAGDDGGPGLPAGDPGASDDATRTSTAVVTSTLEGGLTNEPATTGTVDGAGTQTPAGTAPDLRGMTGAQAKQTLTDLDLTWTIVTRDGADEDSGIVTDQAPQPAQPLETDNVILLIGPAQ